MKKSVLFSVFLLGIASYGQAQSIGINTALPNTTLDVNGDVTIRETNKLSGTTQKLFIDDNGKIGLDYRPKQVAEATVFSANTERRIVNPNGKQFNEGVQFELWVKTEDIKLNTIGITRSGNYFKIGETGTYMLSGFVNFLIEQKVNANTFIIVTIEGSKDNGKTWYTITGSRPVFRQYAEEQYHGHSVPTASVEITEGTLMRMGFTRSKSGSSFQGTDVVSLSVEAISTEGIKSMDLLIRKL